MENVTVRMAEAELELVERLAEARGVSRSDAIRDAVRGGAREALVGTAIERYRAGDCGIRDAAELADVSIAELLTEANDRGVLLDVESERLAEEVGRLR